MAALLVGLLMTAALGMYYICISTSLRYEKNIATSEEATARIIRLRSILRSIRRLRANDPFYVLKNPGSDHLFFSYFGGIRYEEKCSNEHMGQLYVNNAHELLFVSSPYKKPDSTEDREEKAVVLWPDVSSISFSFIVPDTEATGIPGLSSLLQDGLLYTWEKDWPGLPSVITVTINERSSKKPIIISCIVYSSLQPIQVQ